MLRQSLPRADLCLSQKTGSVSTQDLWMKPLWEEGLCRCDHIKMRPPWVRVSL